MSQRVGMASGWASGGDKPRLQTLEEIQSELGAVGFDDVWARALTRGGPGHPYFAGRDGKSLVGAEGGHARRGVGGV